MKRLLSLFLAMMFVFCMVGVASATVVTFDDVITYGGGHTFSTQGYYFDVATGHYHLESTTRFGTNSATTSLVIDDYMNSYNMLTVGEGSVFSLNSLQVNSWGTDPFGSTTVSIVGSLSGGGTVSYTHNASAINTFDTLDLDWTNLVAVSFTGSGNSGAGENFYRLDNIDMVAGAAIPEPATILLFGSGLFSVFAIRRNRLS